MQILFHAHSGVRYLVLLAGLIAVVYAAIGLFGRKPYDRGGRITMQLFVGLWTCRSSSASSSSPVAVLSGADRSHRHDGPGRGGGPRDQRHEPAPAGRAQELAAPFGGAVSPCSSSSAGSWPSAGRSCELTLLGARRVRAPRYAGAERLRLPTPVRRCTGSARRWAAQPHCPAGGRGRRGRGAGAWHRAPRRRVHELMTGAGPRVHGIEGDGPGGPRDREGGAAGVSSRARRAPTGAEARWRTSWAPCPR